MKPVQPLALLALSLAFLAFPKNAQADDPLPSWSDGGAKQSIVDFVGKVTKSGSPDFLPPEERIATFDKLPFWLSAGPDGKSVLYEHLDQQNSHVMLLENFH